MRRLSIETVMGRLEPYLDDFVDIAHRAHEVYRGYKAEVLIEHSRRSAANCMYDHMVAEAERRFLDRQDIRQLGIRGLKLWLLGRDEHSVIRWKKMDEDGRSRNYQTKQAEAFDRMDELPGLPLAPTRVTVGYLLDPSATKILRVQVARPNGRGVDWCAAVIPVADRRNGGPVWEDVSMQQSLTG